LYHLSIIPLDVSLLRRLPIISKRNILVTSARMLFRWRSRHSHWSSMKLLKLFSNLQENCTRELREILLFSIYRIDAHFPRPRRMRNFQLGHLGRPTRPASSCICSPSMQLSPVGRCKQHDETGSWLVVSYFSDVYSLPNWDDSQQSWNSIFHSRQSDRESRVRKKIWLSKT